MLNKYFLKDYNILLNVIDIEMCVCVEGEYDLQTQNMF